MSAVFGGAAVVAAFMSRKIAMGQAETALRADIRSTRQSVRDISLQIETVRDGRRDDELRAPDRRRLDTLGHAFNEAVEENLNAYEGACARFLDGKIDRKRFFKMFHAEIRSLVECENTSPVYPFLHPEGTSKFKAIWKVYRKWNHHE